MDVPMLWLKEYTDVTADIKQFIEDITLTGSKVEGYTTIGGDIEKVLNFGRQSALKNTIDIVFSLQCNTKIYKTLKPFMRAEKIVLRANCSEENLSVL